jgi:hypothetical protein
MKTQQGSHPFSSSPYRRSSCEDLRFFGDLFQIMQFLIRGRFPTFTMLFAPIFPAKRSSLFHPPLHGPTPKRDKMRDTSGLSRIKI